MMTTNIDQLIDRYPLVKDLTELKECAWFNQSITNLEHALPYVGMSSKDILDASQRLSRFASYLVQAFPETAKTNGIIESDLVEIASMKALIEHEYATKISGRLLLKKDSHLPISGSIKARGGIYEVPTHAEKLAIEAGLLTESDDYS